MTLPLPAAPTAAILACTDGSPASEGAVQAALTLAPRWPARLFFLQVLEFNPGFACQAIDYIHNWEREVKEGLENLRVQAAARGLRAETLAVQSPEAFRAILAAAENLQVDLIIMGRRGHTSISRLLMGSTTARVIGFSPVPVLAVPRGAPLTFRRLLVGSDGSSYSRAAWQTALRLAQTRQAELIAVSAAPEIRDLPEAEGIIREMLAEAAGSGVSPIPLVVEGQPDEALVQAAASQGADLIILGSHGRTGLTRLLMGSVTERVIGHAHCAVLVVKLREEGAGAANAG